MNITGDRSYKGFSMRLTQQSMFLLALHFVSARCIDYKAEWDQFKSTYSKSYESFKIETLRRQIYFNNKMEIEKHNDRFQRGETGYSLKMNRFGDMLPHEVVGTVTSVPYENQEPSTSQEQLTGYSSSHLPSSVDWRPRKVVTDVKDQQKCGSCWAFSATGSLEGQQAIKYGKLVSLSEQQLVDCSIKDGNEGCNGGNVDSAFKYIQRNGGINSEASYPYDAEINNCNVAGDIAATVSGYVDLPQGNEYALQEAVANIGPISVNIDAENKSFHFYHQGVYEEPSCSNTTWNHAVLVVGYGEFEGKPYWLVKNSWGAHWGLDGYIWMIRNNENQCSIATKASYPLV